MLDDDPDAKTYYDLTHLLPDVAKILLWWTRDEDGIPHFINRAAFYGLDHELLIEVEVDDVEELPSSMQNEVSSADQPLPDRLPAALMVLSWLDAFSLTKEGDATVVLLPSASQVPDEPPLEWGQP